MGQPGLLHQRDVFAETVNEIGSDCRTVAVMPHLTIVFVPEIDPRILPRFLAAPALGLPGGGRRPEDKVPGDFHLFNGHALFVASWLAA